MCGRFFVSDSTDDFFEQVDNLKKIRCAAGDIRPSEKAIIATQGKGCAANLTEHRWGFANPRGTGLIINARSETIEQKPMFADCFEKRRCIIPADGFYEWDAAGIQHSFFRKTQRCMLMAGVYNADGFVVITTQANESMKHIHTRMPLLIPEKEWEGWLSDKAYAQRLLNSEPEQLGRHITDGQISFI